MWKSLFSKTCLFVLDLSIVYLSTLLFSIHMSLFMFIPHFPNVRYSLPPLLFCVALVILYKIVNAVLCRRGKERASRILSTSFLGFFALMAAVSLLLTSRLVWFQIAFPKILVLIAVIASFLAVWIVFRWWKWRTVPLFLVLVLTFNFLILRISRYTIEEKDLLPLSTAGVKVIRQIDNPDAPAPGNQPPGMNGLIMSGLKSFGGFLMASHQFGYVYAEEGGRVLYVSDFSIRSGITNIFKIGLDDLQTTASIQDKGYFRDMILGRDGKEFMATNCISQEVCYYRSGGLEPITCVGLDVPSVLNLLELPEGGLVVSSEHGFLTFIGPDRRIRRQFRPPIFCEEILYPTLWPSVSNATNARIISRSMLTINSKRAR